jgi:triosephosphate isomerase (TIM)
MTRKPILAANWKMNFGPREAKHFLASWSSLNWPKSAAEMWIFPPILSIPSVQESMQDAHLKNLSPRVGAQNCSTALQGAFTGETSVKMLKEIGIPLVLIGHSERRNLFHETDAELTQKAKLAVENACQVLFCIGESLSERESGQTNAVILRQIEALTADPILKEHLGISVHLAYEPVWAIGTGKVATPEMAQEVHAAIRAEIERATSPKQAKAIRILYGGSVQPDNFEALLSQEDIDGGLVGGASLKADAWNRLWQITCKMTEEG